MDDLTVPVEQGGSQGCPLAGTFFIIGLSLLVEKVSLELKGAGRHAWLMDDGFFVGSIVKSKKLFWTEKLNKFINESSEDKKIGYRN